MKGLIRIAGAVLVLIWLTTPAVAATYYTATSGNDRRTCTQAQTIGTPKQTVNSGIGCLTPGDTLLVRAGTYDENITSVPSGTSWANKVRVAAYPGETVWLKPTSADAGRRVIWLDCECHYVEFDGINLDGTTSNQSDLWTSTNSGHDPHHIRLQNAELIAGSMLNGTAISLGAHALIGATGANELINLTIHGGGVAGACGFECASYGVYIQGPNNLLQGLDIYDTSGAGIQVYSGAGDAAINNIIRNNRIHDISRLGDINEVWGILLATSGNLVYNNVIYGITISGMGGPGDAAISIGDGSNNNSLWNNTIYNVANSGIYVGTGSSNSVRNNIVYMAGGSNYVDTGAGTTHDHNLEGTNPVFVNAGAFDFHLQTSSPAKDTGATLAGVPTDLDDIARPQGSAYDIGAYEYHGSTPPSAPTGLHIVP